MKQTYLSKINSIERMHRQYLEIIRNELEVVGARDINNVQALIVYNIGGDELTVGEITFRGHYLGSNVSYNVKKLDENEYLHQERSSHDRRGVRVRLTEKGLTLTRALETLMQRHVDSIYKSFELDSLTDTTDTLHRLESFWLQELGFGPRIGEFRRVSVAS